MAASVEPPQVEQEVPAGHVADGDDVQQAVVHPGVRGHPHSSCEILPVGHHYAGARALEPDLPVDGQPQRAILVGPEGGQDRTRNEAKPPKTLLRESTSSATRPPNWSTPAARSSAASLRFSVRS